MFSRILSGVFAFIVLITLFSSYTVIKPGNVGVVFNKWTGSLSTHSQGVVFKIPFVTTVQSYPSSLRTYTMVSKVNEGSSKKEDDSVDLPTKEGQHIRQDISITFNTSELRASEVFKSFRGDDVEDIEATFIRRTTITVLQNISGSMSLSELISTKRDELQDNVTKQLSIQLDKMGFVLDKVNLGASHLPASIEEQMQMKMKVQQEAQQAEYTLQKEQTLAKALVAKAHGEADAEVVKAQGSSEANRKLQSTLTPLLIEYEKIKTWDGKLPTYSGLGNSIINLQSK